MFGYNCPIFIFQVVFEDALDLKEAVDICYNAIFGNHGQNCCAGNFFLSLGLSAKSTTPNDNKTKLLRQ